MYYVCIGIHIKLKFVHSGEGSLMKRYVHVMSYFEHDVLFLKAKTLNCVAIFIPMLMTHAGNF